MTSKERVGLGCRAWGGSTVWGSGFRVEAMRIDARSPYSLRDT